MGKRHAALIEARQGKNECNLNNPKDSSLLVQIKEQKRVAQYKQIRNKTWHRFQDTYRDYMKKSKKASEKRNLLIIGRIGIPFGFWKFWILEGLIGPADEKGELI
jgi:hypothetical protein